MTRDELFALAYRNGWRSGRALTPIARARIVSELRTYFAGDTGRRALALAPGVATDSGMRPMTVEDATQALVEELAT